MIVYMMHGFVISLCLLLSTSYVFGKNAVKDNVNLSKGIFFGIKKPLKSAESCTTEDQAVAYAQSVCDFDVQCNQLQSSINCAADAIRNKCGDAMEKQVCGDLNSILSHMNSPCTNFVYTCSGTGTDTNSCTTEDQAIAYAQSVCNFDVDCNQLQNSINCAANAIRNKCGDAMEKQVCGDLNSILSQMNSPCTTYVYTCSGTGTDTNSCTTEDQAVAYAQSVCDFNVDCGQLQNSINCAVNAIRSKCGDDMEKKVCGDLSSILSQRGNTCNGITCSATTHFVTGSIAALLLFKLLLEKFF